MGSLKLNLGCGFKATQGYVNVDITERDGVDLVYDLNHTPWPWDDNSVDEIMANDALEHLAPLGKAEGQMNIVAVLQEIHRVLKPHGKLVARIPTTDGPGAWQDPTHVTYWNTNTLLYFGVESPYGPPDWPKFSIFWNEEQIALAAEKPIAWIRVVMVKPDED